MIYTEGQATREGEYDLSAIPENGDLNIFMDLASLDKSSPELFRLAPTVYPTIDQQFATTNEQLANWQPSIGIASQPPLTHNTFIPLGNNSELLFNGMQPQSTFISISDQNNLLNDNNIAYNPVIMSQCIPSTTAPLYNLQSQRNYYPIYQTNNDASSSLSPPLPPVLGSPIMLKQEQMLEHALLSPPQEQQHYVQFQPYQQLIPPQQQWVLSHGNLATPQSQIQEVLGPKKI
jgi:hypothetical protein